MRAWRALQCGRWPLKLTVSCPMKRGHLLLAVGLVACLGIAAADPPPPAPKEDPAPCQVSSDVSIEAQIYTNSSFGQHWEYHGQSGGKVTLHVTYFLSPMGELSGSFQLDPGEINYAICVAEVADFFTLPNDISGTSSMVDGPVLAITIRRGSTTKTVKLYDPVDVDAHGYAARFHRVWDRIFQPLPVRPVWIRAANQRLERP